MKCILTTLLFILAVLLVSLRLLDRQPPDPAVNYEEILELTMPEATILSLAGSEVEETALNRFKSLWSVFTSENITANVSRVYAENVWFNDTVKTITNRIELEHYLAETASRVASCRIEFLNIMHEDENYFSRWKMTIQPYEDNPDELWISFGITHLRFNEAGRVIMHQDYWDAAGGMYEHLPVVGWILRNIRSRL